MVASHVPPTGDLALNPGMFPDWESNQQPFGLQACAQSTELYQPGRGFPNFCLFFISSSITVKTHTTYDASPCNLLRLILCPKT